MRYGSISKLQRFRRPALDVEFEEELLSYAMKHGIEVHGYTEEAWNQEYLRTRNTFRKLKKSA
ncbi:MAG: hypothetical protein QN720_13905 [Nitrososphaeraceae archaeon]|nr:hypothetical protein [Nitrososphaeraceae archaeon]